MPLQLYGLYVSYLTNTIFANDIFATGALSRAVQGSRWRTPTSTPRCQAWARARAKAEISAQSMTRAYAFRSSLPGAATCKSAPGAWRPGRNRPLSSALKTPIFVRESKAAGAGAGTAFGEELLAASRKEREHELALSHVNAVLGSYPRSRRLDVPNRRPPAAPHARPPLRLGLINSLSL